MRAHLISGAAFTMALTVSGLAGASSHREAPAISMDPAADNTDVYAWVTPGTHDKLYVIAAYNPLEEPSGGPNFHKFSDDVLYEVHITRGDSSLADVVTYQIRFTTAPIQYVDPADLTKPPGGGKEFFAQLAGSFNQTYTLTKVVGNKSTVVAKNVPVAPPNIGPRTQAVGKSFGIFSSATYDDTYAATFIQDNGSEGRVWAGPRDDGFYVDLARVFDLADFAGNATPPLTTATDGVSGFNCHAIALEIPTNLLTSDGNPPTSGASDAQTLGVWASASRRKVHVTRHNGDDDDFGPWIQVSRLGLPLINEAVIGIQDKDKYNRTKPATDVTNFGAYFLNPVVVRDAAAVGVYAALGADPTPFESNRTDIIDTINLTNIPSMGAHAIPLSSTGDVLRVDIGVDSGFPNGRPLIGGAQPNQEQANVTDTLLTLILTKGAIAVANGAKYNDKNYLTTFPYLALPWEGARQGHGKPTP
jgi:uncharacterized protein DUF4331